MVTETAGSIILSLPWSYPPAGHGSTRLGLYAASLSGKIACCLAFFARQCACRKLAGFRTVICRRFASDHLTSLVDASEPVFFESG
jgi:hypothetical protein